MTLIDKYYFNKYDIDFIYCGLFYGAFYCLTILLAVHF